MTTGQPDENAPELDEDAGINAIRLDTERAREDLELTLTEIERRLDPQRFLQPVTGAVKRTTAALTRAYKNNPVGFVMTAVFVVGAVSAVLIWAGTGSSPDATKIDAKNINAQRLDANKKIEANKVDAARGPRMVRTRRAKPVVNPALKASRKTTKKAIRAVVKAHK